MSAALDTETGTIPGINLDADVPCQTKHSECSAPADGALIFRCCKKRFTLCLTHYGVWATHMAALRSVFPALRCRYCDHTPLIGPDWVPL